MVNTREKDLLEVGFDAGLKAVVRLLDNPSNVSRQGIIRTVAVTKDNFQTCTHGRYLDEPCYECLKASILDLLERREMDHTDL